MKNFWDLYAWVYDLLWSFSPYAKMQKKVVERLQLIPNLRILDTGCGTGNTIRMIAEMPGRPYGTKVFGLDRSPDMLRRAKKKLAGQPDISFYPPGNYNEIPGTDRYDRIISVNSLYASSDPAKTLKHWYDRLEDGGLLVMNNPLSKSDVLQGLVENVGFKILSRETIYRGSSVLVSAQKDENALVRRAQTSEEIEEVFRLRYNKYCLAIKMVDPASCRDRQETDRFDSFATHFIARDRGKIVGSIRYIPDAGIGFLLEEHFALPPEIAANEIRQITVEISRATLLMRYGGGALSMSLLEEAIKFALVHGYSCFIAASTKEVWNIIERNGGEVKIWGEFKKDYHRTRSAPGLISLLFKEDDKFNDIYLGSPGRRIFHKCLPWRPGTPGGHEI